MKSLLVCIISNKFETVMVRCTRKLMEHRLGDWNVREIQIGNNFLPSNLSRICNDARNDGYARICFQTATMAFSDDRYRDLIKETVPWKRLLK